MWNNSSSSVEHLNFCAVKLQACLIGLEKGALLRCSTCSVGWKQYEKRRETKTVVVIVLPIYRPNALNMLGCYIPHVKIVPSVTWSAVLINHTNSQLLDLELCMLHICRSHPHPFYLESKTSSFPPQPNHWQWEQGYWKAIKFSKTFHKKDYNVNGISHS